MLVRASGRPARRCAGTLGKEQEDNTAARQGFDGLEVVAVAKPRWASIALLRRPRAGWPHYRRRAVRRSRQTFLGSSRRRREINRWPERTVSGPLSSCNITDSWMRPHVAEVPRPRTNPSLAIETIPSMRSVAMARRRCKSFHGRGPVAHHGPDGVIGGPVVVDHRIAALGCPMLRTPAGDTPVPGFRNRPAASTAKSRPGRSLRPALGWLWKAQAKLFPILGQERAWRRVLDDGKERSR